MAHVGVGASSKTNFPAHIIEIGSRSVHKTPFSPLLPLSALLHPHPPLHLHQLLTQPPASLLHPEEEMCFSDSLLRLPGGTYLASGAPGCCQSPHKLIPKVLTIS